MMTKMKRKKNDVGNENKINNNNDETAVFVAKSPMKSESLNSSNSNSVHCDKPHPGIEGR